MNMIPHTIFKNMERSAQLAQEVDEFLKGGSIQKAVTAKQKGKTYDAVYKCIKENPRSTSFEIALKLKTTDYAIQSAIIMLRKGKKIKTIREVGNVIVYEVAA